MEQPASSRVWFRFRFRLRTLLIAPLVVVALLLAAFPKLVTGDFLEVDVISIENVGNGTLQIELATTISSGTAWRAVMEMDGGPFRSMGTTGKRWTGTIPTWPKHNSIVVELVVSRDRLPPKIDDIQDVIIINDEDTYDVTPNLSLVVARAEDVNGNEGSCRLEVVPGNRLGW